MILGAGDYNNTKRGPELAKSRIKLAAMKDFTKGYDFLNGELPRYRAMAFR